MIKESYNFYDLIIAGFFVALFILGNHSLKKRVAVDEGNMK